MKKWAELSKKTIKRARKWPKASAQHHSLGATYATLLIISFANGGVIMAGDETDIADGLNRAPSA